MLPKSAPLRVAAKRARALQITSRCPYLVLRMDSPVSPQCNFPRNATLVIALAAVLYLVGNAGVSLWDRDEPRFAQTSRQMLQSGDWVVPRFLDIVRTAKPPLTYWCQATAMSLIGDGAGGWGDTAAARLPSTAGIVATLIVLGGALTRWVDRERAFWTVLILSTSGIVIGFLAKGSMHDGILLLWVTIAQVCLYAILRGRATWPVVMAMSLAIGLGILTKGPVILGVMATTLLALAFLSWLGRPARVFFPEGARAGRPTHGVAKAIVSLIVIVAVVGPWVWLVEHRSPGFLYSSVSRE